MNSTSTYGRTGFPILSDQRTTIPSLGGTQSTAPSDHKYPEILGPHLEKQWCISMYQLLNGFGYGCRFPKLGAAPDL